MPPEGATGTVHVNWIRFMVHRLAPPGPMPNGRHVGTLGRARSQPYAPRPSAVWCRARAACLDFAGHWGSGAMRFSMPIVAVLAVLTTLPAIAADPPDQNARRIAATDALSIVAAPGWSSCDPAINQKIGAEAPAKML